jgi:hypothetical protein
MTVKWCPCCACMAPRDWDDCSNCRDEDVPVSLCEIPESCADHILELREACRRFEAELQAAKDAVPEHIGDERVLGYDPVHGETTEPVPLCERIEALAEEGRYAMDRCEALESETKTAPITTALEAKVWLLLRLPGNAFDDESLSELAEDLAREMERVRSDEREACAKLCDHEQRACEGHLRAVQALGRKGVQHRAGAQIARDCAAFIRRRAGW